MKHRPHLQPSLLHPAEAGLDNPGAICSPVRRPRLTARLVPTTAEPAELDAVVASLK